MDHTTQSAAILPTLKRGDKGPAVALIQTQLRALGYKNTKGKYAGQPLVVDGMFGPNTEAAVTAFRAEKMSQSGSAADHATRLALAQAAPGVVAKQTHIETPEGVVTPSSVPQDVDESPFSKSWVLVGGLAAVGLGAWLLLRRRNTPRGTFTRSKPAASVSGGVGGAPPALKAMQSKMKMCAVEWRKKDKKGNYRGFMKTCLKD